MVQLPLFSEKGVYKFFSIENLEILHSFSQANVLDRDTEMIRNTDHDATFGRSVQFGNRQSIHLGCSRKLLGLFKCVLSGRTVQYQQDFVRCIGNHFLHHILDLGQLVHQIDLVMQATGGIDNHHIRPVRLCRTQRVKCH